MDERLKEGDLADLSAWLDGELTGPRAAEVERLVRDDAAWRDALAELMALDSALESYCPPAPAAGLAERIIRASRLAARPRSMAIRLVRWLAPVAAAAAVLALAVMVHNRSAGPSRPAAPQAADQRAELVDEILKDVPAEDKFVVEFLEFFRNYELCGVMAESESLLDTATLDALDRIEEKGT